MNRHLVLICVSAMVFTCLPRAQARAGDDEYVPPEWLEGPVRSTRQDRTLKLLGAVGYCRKDDVLIPSASPLEEGWIVLCASLLHPDDFAYYWPELECNAQVPASHRVRPLLSDLVDLGWIRLLEDGSYEVTRRGKRVLADYPGDILAREDARHLVDEEVETLVIQLFETRRSWRAGDRSDAWLMRAFGVAMEDGIHKAIDRLDQLADLGRQLEQLGSCSATIEFRVQRELNPLPSVKLEALGEWLVQEATRLRHKTLVAAGIVIDRWKDIAP